MSRAQLPNYRQNGGLLWCVRSFASCSCNDVRQFIAHTSIFCRIPQYSSALAVPKTVAKRPRSDGQDASRPGPAVTPQAKDSAAAVEQLASLQCRLSLKGVAKKPVTDLVGKTQAVLPLSTYSEAVSRGKQVTIQGRAGHTV